MTHCLISGKFYVGKYMGKDKGYLGSGTVFKTALKKYGRENFVRIILDTFSLSEDGCAREIFWIKEKNTKVPNGYNLTDGGGGLVNPCQETRDKISMARRGDRHPNFGKHFSEESKARMRTAKIGHSVSEATRTKISVGLIGNLNGKGNEGNTRPEAIRAKISFGLMGNTNARKSGGMGV